MTKKGHQKFLPPKWKFLLKKTSSWSAKICSVPPNSAPGFRHCPQGTLCSFFSDKISSLRVTLRSLLASQSSTADPLPTPIPLPPPSQSSLQILHPASETEVLLLLNSLPNKQCESDPIPTSLLKDCASVLLPVITQIINLSLSTGNFPLAFKHSLVNPLLKKANLDKENLSNYRPISNLSFLSKLTERIV